MRTAHQETEPQTALRNCFKEIEGKDYIYVCVCVCVCVCIYIYVILVKGEYM